MSTQHGSPGCLPVASDNCPQHSNRLEHGAWQTRRVLHLTGLLTQAHPVPLTQRSRIGDNSCN